MRSILKQTVKAKILNDPILHGKVAQELGIKPTGLYNTLARDTNSLTSVDFLTFLSKETGILINNLTTKTPVKW